AAPTSMGVLQRQLDEAHIPLAEARPNLPRELSGLVDRLLRADPERRPQGARDVLDALELRSLPPDEAPARALPTAPTRHLAPGSWTVVVRERGEDAGRRQRRRNQATRRFGPERQLQ